MPILWLCRGAVGPNQFRYWRPGLHNTPLPIQVPVLRAPDDTHAIQRHVNQIGAMTTLIRFTDRLPRASLLDTASSDTIHDSEEQPEEQPEECDEEIPAGPSKKKRKSNETEGVDSVLRAYHIRIRPDKHARASLRHMMAGVNATHNMAVKYLRQCTGFQSAYNVRDALVPSAVLPPDKKWLSIVPTRPRANKVLQVVEAYNRDMKNKGRRNFEMHFHSFQKARTLTMEFSKGSGVANSFRVDPRFHGTSRTHAIMELPIRSMVLPNGDKIPRSSLSVRMCDSPWLIKHILEHGIEHAYRVKWDRPLNRWWLVVVIDKKKVGGPEHQLRNVVALDPGSRTFQTTYDPSGHVMKFGTDTRQRVLQLCKRVDHRVARLAAYKGAQKQRCTSGASLPPVHNHELRSRYRNAIRRTRYLQHAASRKVYNTVVYMHWKVVNALFERYDTVLIPEFKTTSMLPMLQSKTARSLATLSHYSFRMRLVTRAEENLNHQVVVTREPGTSRTCCLCGTWNQSLGANEVLHCVGCRASIERDTNGACGNLLAYVTESPHG